MQIFVIAIILLDLLSDLRLDLDLFLFLESERLPVLAPERTPDLELERLLLLLELTLSYQVWQGVLKAPSLISSDLHLSVL